MEQGLAEDVHGLTQTLAGLLVRPIAPQQRRQMVTPMGLARSQREIGQEGLDLLGGKCQHLSPGQTGLETTEKGERESAHVDYPNVPEL